MIYAKAAIATLGIAALVACGGGGGGSAPAPTPTPSADTQKPTISSTASTPMGLTQTFSVASDEALNGNGFVVTVKNGGADVALSNVFGKDGKSATISPATLWPAGAVLNVSVSATDLAGNVGTATFALSTAATPLSAAAAIGTKVFGANQLPAGCTTQSQQCWKDAAANGTVKFLATNGKMIGTSNATRTIVFAYYRTESGLWAVTPVYADEATPVSTNINRGSIAEVDFAVGTAGGAIFRDKPSGLCVEMLWYPPTTTPAVNSNVWAVGSPVVCP